MSTASTARDRQFRNYLSYLNIVCSNELDVGAVDVTRQVGHYYGVLLGDRALSVHSGGVQLF